LITFLYPFASTGAGVYKAPITTGRVYKPFLNADFFHAAAKMNGHEMVLNPFQIPKRALLMLHSAFTLNFITGKITFVTMTGCNRFADAD
jgi:hypothetical protein